MDPNVQALLMARQISDTTGGLHELQERQLKLAPRIVLKDCTASKAIVDTDTRTVEIQARFSGPVSAQDKQMAEKLAVHFQWFLGASWLVQIVENRNGVMNPIHTQPRKRDFDPAKYTGTDFEAGKIVPEKPWNFLKKKLRSQQ